MVASIAGLNGGALSGITGAPLSLPLQILVLMTGLAVLPTLVLMMTGFTRILIVLSILRQALGLQQTPPNQILVGMALFLTLFVMRPAITEIDRLLLDLTAARIAGTQVAVSSLCIAAAVPATTALRAIRAMTDRGLFKRVADGGDKRRVFIELAESTAAGMMAYLSAAKQVGGIAG